MWFLKIHAHLPHPISRGNLSPIHPIDRPRRERFGFWNAWDLCDLGWYNINLFYDTCWTFSTCANILGLFINSLLNSFPSEYFFFRLENTLHQTVELLRLKKLLHILMWKLLTKRYFLMLLLFLSVLSYTIILTICWLIRMMTLTYYLCYWGLKASQK